jgi:2-polyprenyl-6-methoxyphenol hydroxylase-like FAD-dependent oxidoreductase
MSDSYPSTTAPSAQRPHVIVIGGGLGGLCLAQGLLKSGGSVAVYERDRTPDDRLQGYRLHVNPAGSRALHASLPPRLYADFVSICGVRNSRFGFYTEHLQELLSLEFADHIAAADNVEGHKSVSRAGLRRVLLTGLDDVVHFEKSFTHYTIGTDGRPTAHFADGTSATGDVLVGADGVNSHVRAQYLPHAQVVDTGVLSLRGRAPLTAELRHMLPRNLLEGPAAISAPGGVGLFVAIHEACPPHASDSGLSWGVAIKRSGLPIAEEAARRLAGEALKQVALDLLEGWHPTLRAIVTASDPRTVALHAVRSSVPLAAWPTSRVTLLGDAIHSMTPSRGIGANTALRDAALLTEQLNTAGADEPALLGAIHAYETDMQTYGFEAVRSSMQALQAALRFDSPFAVATARIVLRTINAVPPLKRKIFAGFGDA